MSEGDVRQENTYWSREMADLLKIGDSTLRKWCRVLEAQGYRFIRDDQERRAFTDHDALALRYFKELTQDKGVSLDSAAKAVAERFNRGAVQGISPSATKLPERYDSAMQQILDYMKRQEEFNNRLLQELADQRRYIDESLNRWSQGDWSNNACLGYAIFGAQQLGYSDKQTKELVRAIYRAFDEKTVEEARQEYERSPY